MGMRISFGLIGMRSPKEVDRDVEIATNREPPVDFATPPRLTFAVYQVEDETQP
jgi:hypothetical protein